MGFFNELFNRSNDQEEEASLGRFSDAYKPSSQYEIWEESILAYENEEYLRSTLLLLNFLKNPKQDNISFSEAEEEIRFEFYQGSKIIIGHINRHKFRAEAIIAAAQQLNIGLSRSLLERNYLLKYSRFAVNDDGHILLIFDSYTLDASPNKLYQGLKELATQADKLDDLILDEFKDMRPINQDHLIHRGEEVKERQYKYLVSSLNKCFDEIDHGKLNIDQFPGGLSFLLLATNYKLDYLLTPEGLLMDVLEQNHRVFFTYDREEVGHKNNHLVRSFRKILERSKEDVKIELYDVVSTFGLPDSTPHETLSNLISNELAKMQWYKENNHTAIALAIPSYIVGYSLFSYALPLPDMKLLELFYKVTESDFLNGGQFIKNGLPISKKVKKELDKIERKYKSIHPEMEIDHTKIKYDSMVSFSETFLVMIKDLNLTQS